MERSSVTLRWHVAQPGASPAPEWLQSGGPGVLAPVQAVEHKVLAPVFYERARRLWAATESLAIGYGGDAFVSAATGLARYR